MSYGLGAYDRVTAAAISGSFSTKSLAAGSSRSPKTIALTAATDDR